MKKSGKISLLVGGMLLGATAIYLALPSHYYIRRALVHQLPKIDQYPIFENRVVRAADPQPWPRSSRYGSQQIDPALLPAFDRFGTVAYVVVQNDSLLFERYWDGFSDHSLSNSFSMAKSIVSLLIGAALDEGLISSLDQPVRDFIPEFGDFNGKPLTLKDLLTMSAGVEWDEGYSGLFSLTTEAYYGNDLVKQIRHLRQNAEPGVQFYYQSGVTQILGLILEIVTGKSLSAYASEKLWTPLGAEHDALWSLDRKEGHEKAYCCFNSNARDFARFGQLVLNRGAWGGQQLISSDYIAEATRPATWLLGENGKDLNRNYGYQFWILEYEGMRIPYMRGILGQYVFVIPDKNAVIVRLGRQRSDTRDPLQNYPDDIDVWLDAGLKMLE